MVKDNFLIVGAGLFGAVISNLLSNINKSCFIIDKRNHIGGNCFTFKKNGIDVHKYGAHIFYTDNKNIWNFINRFCEMKPYIHHVKACYNNKLYTFPINLDTLYEIYGICTPHEANVLFENFKNLYNNNTLSDKICKFVGPKLYNMFYKEYTEKQWGTDINKLPLSIVNNIPIKTTFNSSFHNKIYSGIPTHGYTTLIKNIIGDVPYELNVDFISNFSKLYNKFDHIIYTGPIDKLLEYKYGKLQYRSLKFESYEYNINDYQGISVINYPEKSYSFSRIIEHKHFNFINNNYTIITKEYPINYTNDTEPYYPIESNENLVTYQKYRILLKNKYPNIYVGGRLGMYKYINMEQTIELAYKLFDTICNNNK